MPTYYGSGSAEGKAIARFQYRNAELVTATATATATSTVSQADANQIAQQTAQQVATSQAENDRNIIVQAVNTATSNETTYGLESSFMEDSIKATSTTSFELTKSYQVEDGKTLRIDSNQTLTIGGGVTLSIGRGRFLNEGQIIISGGTLLLGSEPSSPLTTQTSSNTGISFLATPIDLSNNNSGTIDISNNGVAIVSPGVTFTNGITDASGTFGLITLNGGTILNYGTFNNVGDIFGYETDFSNNIINGVPRTKNGTKYAPTQNVLFNNTGQIGQVGPSNVIGILNGDISNNYSILFSCNVPESIVISGSIVNNSYFDNNNPSTIQCLGLTNTKNGSIFNTGTIYCTSFINTGNVEGSPPIVQS
jgi:hypothetical protein